MPMELVTWEECLQRRDVFGFSGSGILILPKKFHDGSEIVRNLDGSPKDLAKLISPEDLELIDNPVSYIHLRNVSIAGYNFRSTRALKIASAYGIQIGHSDHDEIGVLGGNSKITHASGIRIGTMEDSAMIDNLWCYRVDVMKDSTKIGYAGAKIGTMKDHASIDVLGDDSLVSLCQDDASIGSMRGGSKVGRYITTQGMPTGTLSLAGN